MNYLEPFRNPQVAYRLLQEIRATVTRDAANPWTLMEVCGGQTHSLLRNGIDRLLPPGIQLIHGPGCPVCVTPVATIDRALAIAARPEVIFCSFGDMLRVPGSTNDLQRVRSTGGDVRVVYSPLDAVEIARQNPAREVVFFAIGFETTAPANAMAVTHARRLGLHNFSLLVSHMLVTPAMEAVLSAPDGRVQAFLAAGHVCSVMGTRSYEPLVERFHVPVVVTGFEPLDLLQGILLAVTQLERGEARVEIAYRRAVQAAGNLPAQSLLAKVFTVANRTWRGIGELPASGWRLADDFAEFDAETRFDVAQIQTAEDGECRSGDVLQGRIKPTACPAFGTRCTPLTPLGATMVSGEGACAAYYRYARSRMQPMGETR